MHQHIKSYPGVQLIETEDFGWENFRYSSPDFRLAHVERFFHDNLLVVHVTVFPHKNNPAPVYGFDVVASEKAGKIMGAFVDYSPVCYDLHWHNETWAKDRKLPVWAKVFSKQFVAIRPEEEEHDKLLEFGYNKFIEYFDLINVKTDDCYVERVIEAQNAYCEHQSQNPKTFAALKHKIGAERAEYFMKKILFPIIEE
jgi:phycocyanobilin:ferredoxin oxidoreductase